MFMSARACESAVLAMSQTKLGDAVGLTFQQIQKYERGSNRIGSSRLYEFAKVLDVPVSSYAGAHAAKTSSNERTAPY
jgi:transcriptional regulator with XRE-family HTH domain